MLETELLGAFELKDGFLMRDGSARGGGRYCNKKLCFTATAVEPMARQLYELSPRPDCYWVKLDQQVGRHGMVRGRCFMKDEQAVAELWKRYKDTEDVLCTIQDDDFTARYRAS